MRHQFSSAGSAVTWGAILAILVALGWAAAPAGAAFPGANGRLALGSTFLGPCDFETAGIVTLDADGSRVRAPARCRFGSGPDWSPDGRRVLFLQASRPALMAADGSGVRRIPFAPTRFAEYKPSFAPDGRHFAFEFSREIWRAPTRGRRVRKLVDGSSPRWSPDGSRIAYVGAHGGIRVMRAADGTSRRLVIPGVNSIGSLDWSPDGRRLLYSQLCCSGELWWVRVDRRDTTPIQLTHNARYKFEAVWSPDGRRIAFLQERRRDEQVRYSIWTMTSRGTRMKRILQSDLLDSETTPTPTLSWGPRP